MGTSLQMTWQKNLLLKRRKKPNTSPPLGLKNLGNTCYLNSVLQCLSYTPPLANYCLNNHHSSHCPQSGTGNCPFCLLEKRIIRSLTLDFSIDAPSKILTCINIFSPHFRYGRQEDAHEFLRFVIDACHNACLKINKNTSIVRGIFGGKLRSQVKCCDCGAESNKTDDIMDISLDLFQVTSVKDAMQRCFQQEVLNGTNKYHCDNCEKLVVAKKQLAILKAPNVLVIQLKVMVNDGILVMVLVVIFQLCVFFSGRSSGFYKDLKEYMVGRLIKRLHSKRVYFFLITCAKKARIHVHSIIFMVPLCILAIHPILDITMHTSRMQWVGGIAAMIPLYLSLIYKRLCLKRLAKDASSRLRSCGWYDEVHRFMRGKKRLCAEKGGDAISDTELNRSWCILHRNDAIDTFMSASRKMWSPMKMVFFF